MRESKRIEYKSAVSNTFLKTVSAFANYGTGRILFGISDDGEVKGIREPAKVCLDIENRINDNIEPIPEYTLSINKKTSVITLTIMEGLYKPYLYKAKAYRRNDTATIAVSRLELSRLILEGRSMSFEELPADNQNLSFSALGEKLKETINIETIGQDTLKTLELYKDGVGFNHAAELLSDENGFSGIDIVRFGDSVNTILDREDLKNESILTQYDKAVEAYRKYYQYEQIKGSVRETIAVIPEEAYREAVANALVHRTWDVSAGINIAMFPDKIEITSPGGLPEGMSIEEYNRGGISILRNRIIGNIFFRLNMIERFGTGIRRIHETYRGSTVKPDFTVTDNSIKIMLPVIQTELALSNDENTVYKLLKGRAVASSSVALETGFGKSKAIAILKKLVEQGYAHSTGNGRGTKYTAN